MFSNQKAIDNTLSEMRMIQLQLYLAKRCTKKHKSPRTTLIEVESHINHSLHSLNHLMSYIDDFNTYAEINTSASHRTKEIP